MRIRTSKLFGKKVILDVGIVIGRLEDFEFNKKTGEIYALIIQPEELDPQHRELFRWRGDKIIVPITTLKSIGDFIVLDKNKLQMYKI